MTIECIKDIAQIIALLSAGVFFIYKFISGYLITNLSISLECLRDTDSSDADKDVLVALVKMKKGDRGSLELHDGQVKFSTAEEIIIAPLIGFDRRSFKTERVGGKERKYVNWDKRSESSPYIRLSPGEEAEFSCSCLIPSNKLCNVEVSILGKRTNHWKVGQWRASRVAS